MTINSNSPTLLFFIKKMESQKSYPLDLTKANKLNK